ncbi:MAG: branched-chain amino acid ABC transporter permease [Deltaproteobacteria bacterium]|nr:MAG: branched-chain amino acid ABC transporter permease [Deltaproteobacteria bacterium]
MYALVAIGFSMIYGIIKLINFAHGDILMIGAFTTLGLLVHLGLPIWVVLIGVVAVCGFCGILVERVAFRPMRGAPQVTGFIASLGISIAIQNLGILTLSAQPRNFSFPEMFQQSASVAGFSMRLVDVSIIVLTLALMGVLLYIIHRTRMGVAMRATAENLDVARLMGININKTISVTFALGSAMAGIGGLMWGGKFGQIDPLLGFLPGLKSFVAAVIGGVGSIPGAILGGYILGMAEVLFVGLLPPIYSSYRDAFVFGALILILLILPNGLLGHNVEERA